MYAEFDDTLVTGNAMIDSQHKELIGKINDLLRSCENHGNRTAAVKMLNYLADYTAFQGGGRAPGVHWLSWHQGAQGEA